MSAFSSAAAITREGVGVHYSVLPPVAPNAILFVTDGRFHLEAIMIANPAVPTYRYDPFSRELIKEYYDHEGMRMVRRRAVERSRSAKHWGLVLGTLGRQGNPHILTMLQ
eukprot:gene11763-8952_t